MASKIELPPVAWGSPAHTARVKAEKEWKTHLRAHAATDAASQHAGKHAKFVEGIDVVIRYTLPPVWEDDVVRTEEEKWELPEDDEGLVKVLHASFSPFFQRTGDNKNSGVFKTPPLPAPKKQAATPVIQPQSTPNPPDVDRSHTPAELPPPVTQATPRASDSAALQPRQTYLPVFLSRMLQSIGQLFARFIPTSLRARIHQWWSPLQGKPIGRI